MHQRSRPGGNVPSIKSFAPAGKNGSSGCRSKVAKVFDLSGMEFRVYYLAAFESGAA